MSDVAHTAQKLSHRIKEAREAIGWSQAKLGQACGVQRAQISKLEKDATKASMELFLKICATLKFDILLREQPQTAATPPETKPDFESILSKLSPKERAALEKRARMILEETTKPFLVILPMVQAKMVDLFEADSIQEEAEEVEEEED
jgi:transcriptional regulator with XRE-family HTH domain